MRSSKPQEVSAPSASLFRREEPKASPDLAMLGAVVGGLCALDPRFGLVDAGTGVDGQATPASALTAAGEAAAQTAALPGPATATADASPADDGLAFDALAFDFLLADWTATEPAPVPLGPDLAALVEVGANDSDRAGAWPVFAVEPGIGDDGDDAWALAEAAPTPALNRGLPATRIVYIPSAPAPVPIMPEVSRTNFIKVTPPSMIALIESASLPRPYEKLGEIRVSAKRSRGVSQQDTRQRLDALLRAEAFALNADAVIAVDYLRPKSIDNAGREAVGVAIRFR